MTCKGGFDPTSHAHYAIFLSHKNAFCQSAHSITYGIVESMVEAYTSRWDLPLKFTLSQILKPERSIYHVSPPLREPILLWPDLPIGAEEMEELFGPWIRPINEMSKNSTLECVSFFSKLMGAIVSKRGMKMVWSIDDSDDKSSILRPCFMVLRLSPN